MIAVNLIAVVLHLSLGAYILRNHARYTVLWGLIFFLQTWSLISCGYNDFGVYNFELFRYTDTTLATTRLAMFFVVFNLGFLAIARLLKNRLLVRKDYRLNSGTADLGSFKLMAYLVILAVIAYVVYTFATSGIPVLQGIHKVLFYQEAGPLERSLVNYGFLIAFVLGYVRPEGKRFTVSGALLAAMLIYMVLAGNKFSALLNLLVAYYTPVLVRWLMAQPKFTVMRPKYLAYAAGAVLVLVLFAFISYVFWGGDSQTAGQLLFDRLFALQGHLWWATDYNLFVLDRFDPNHWQAELQGVIAAGGVAEGSVGLKYVTVQAIGAEKAFPIFDIGYLYTMAYPAILVLTFPYPIAMLFQLLMGAAACGLLYYLHFSIQYRHAVRAIIAMTIVVPFVGVLSTGNFWVILTPGAAVKLGLLAALELGLIRTGRARRVASDGEI